MNTHKTGRGYRPNAGWSAAVLACGVVLTAPASGQWSFVDADAGLEASLPPLGSGEPGGELLFDLTEAEIVETVVFYHGEEIDVDSVLEQMRRPFDASRFADIEREAGSEEGALRAIHHAWELGLNRVDYRAAVDEISAMIDDEHEAWFSLTYPDGVDEEDPYWSTAEVSDFDVSQRGPESPLSGWCSASSTVKKNSGKWRIKSESLYHSDGIYRYARGRGTTYKKFILWIKTKVDDLDVDLDGEYYSGGSWRAFSKDCACSDCSKLTCDKLLFEEGEGAYRWTTRVTADPPSAAPFSATSCNEVACCS